MSCSRDNGGTTLRSRTGRPRFKRQSVDVARAHRPVSPITKNSYGQTHWNAAQSPRSRRPCWIRTVDPLRLGWRSKRRFAFRRATRGPFANESWRSLRDVIPTLPVVRSWSGAGNRPSAQRHIIGYRSPRRSNACEARCFWRCRVYSVSRVTAAGQPEINAQNAQPTTARVGAKIANPAYRSNRKSARNSDAGRIPEISRRSRARVQAT